MEHTGFSPPESADTSGATLTSSSVSVTTRLPPRKYTGCKRHKENTNDIHSLAEAPADGDTSHGGAGALTRSSAEASGPTEKMDALTAAPANVMGPLAKAGAEEPEVTSASFIIQSLCQFIGRGK